MAFAAIKQGAKSMCAMSIAGTAAGPNFTYAATQLSLANGSAVEVVTVPELARPIGRP